MEVGERRTRSTRRKRSVRKREEGKKVALSLLASVFFFVGVGCEVERSRD